jgi:predicted nucleic acid-binding protein
VILVDTSVWVDHLRRGSDSLVELLHAGEVACHSLVIGELACGTIHSRAEVLRLLSALPLLPKVVDEEVLDYIERHRLMGKGLGLVDVHLLASCTLAGIPLWTYDRKLAQAASRMGLAPAR